MLSLDFLYEYVEKHPITRHYCTKTIESRWDSSIFCEKFYYIKKFCSLDFYLKGNDQTTSKIVNKYLCRNMDTTKIQPVDWAIGSIIYAERFYAF